MVAKMPLLISSRMMSATLTESSSASSLTVMVAGQLDRAALARVEVWTCEVANAPSRRGGLRGPRRPRVPLLLLATGSSFDGVRGDGPRSDARRNAAGSGVSSARRRAPLLDGDGQAVGPGAHVGAATGQSTGRVGHDRPVRGSDDPLQLALGADRPTGDAGPRRDAARLGRRATRFRRRGYDATSSVAGAASAAFFVVSLGLGRAPRRPRRGRRRRRSVGLGSAVGRRSPRPGLGGVLGLAAAALARLAVAAASAAFFGRALRLGRRRPVAAAAPRRRPPRRPGRPPRRRRGSVSLAAGLGGLARRPRPWPRRPTRRCGCRSASRSAGRRAGRSGPRGRSPARASARAR